MTLSKMEKQKKELAKARAELSKKTWFKVLREEDGKLVSCNGGDMEWERPPSDGMGPLVTAPGVKICTRGLHVTSDANKWDAKNLGKKVFVAEIPWSDPELLVDSNDSDKIAVNRLRLRYPSFDELLAFGIVDLQDSTDYRIYDKIPNGALLVKSGSVRYLNGAPILVQLCGASKFASFTEGVVITGRDNSSADVQSSFVNWYSKGQLQVTSSIAHIYQACNVVASDGAVVHVKGEGCTIFAESGSVVILYVDTHIIAQEGATVLLRGDSERVSGNHIVITDVNGRFSSFVKIEATIPENGSVLFR